MTTLALTKADRDYSRRAARRVMRDINRRTDAYVSPANDVETFLRSYIEEAIARGYTGAMTDVQRAAAQLAGPNAVWFADSFAGTFGEDRL